MHKKEYKKIYTELNLTKNGNIRTHTSQAKNPFSLTIDTNGENILRPVNYHRAAGSTRCQERRVGMDRKWDVKDSDKPP